MFLCNIFDLKILPIAIFKLRNINMSESDDVLAFFLFFCFLSWWWLIIV